MGHNLEQLGTATLDTMGGLVTACNPQDLPEGASPRTWDTDFIVGSVFTRAGLSSVYSYTTTLRITGIVVYNGIATFTYVGTQPSINEGLFLSNFTGQSSFLNGTEVFVITADATTFTATVSGANFSQSGLDALAVSTVGSFVGPKAPTVATTVGTGNVWANPDAILSNVAFSSVLSGAVATVSQIPLNAGNVPVGSNVQWINPSNVLVTGPSVASITLAPGQTSGQLLAYWGTISIPEDATVTGLKVSVTAASSVFGVGSINVQLTNGNTQHAIGTVVNIPLSTSMTAKTAGSASYQWGTTLEPDTVNGNNLAVLISAAVSSGTATITANALSVTVYYELAGGTEALKTTHYVFAIPSTAGITGFTSTFKAYTSDSSSITLQLLKNGIPVGDSKTQALTSTPTIYALGAASDLWGSTWIFSDVNNTEFGVEVTATGAGTTFVNDLDMLTYVTPALANFNYMKSYVQNNGQTYTLALDSNGIMWQENVTSLPGNLSIALTGILAGSFAKSATMDNREHIMFSDLSIGTERPRVFNGIDFAPLTQVGPGAAPAFSAASGTGSSTTLAITHFSITGNVITFTFTAGPTVSPSQVYRISGATPTYVNIVGEVLSSPAPTATTFAMAIQHADAAGDITATGTLLFNYPITSITQNVQKSGFDGGVFWGAGPGPTHAPGSNLVLYYSQTEDKTLTTYFAAHPTSTYVYLGSINNFPQFSNKTYLITSVGIAKPSGTAGAARFYFVVNVGVSGASYPDGTTGTYQLTIATVTTAVSVPDISSGTVVQITGETPTQWNAQWAIVEALNSAVLDITATQMSSTGVATYSFSVPTGGAQPINGQTASIVGCNNSAAGYTTSPFNVIGVIVVPGTLGAGSFDIRGFSGGLPVPFGSETGQASTFGTQFTIDPGVATLGTNTNPIYGNAGPSGVNGGMFPVGSASSSITPGTRQGVVYFIMENGSETSPSPPVVFSVPENSSSVYASNIPLGPPGTKARGIAFTEAGQNGVPGANFYVIETAQTVQVLNSAPVVCTPTVVNDNISTSAVFTFTDAVLLNSREIDVQGDNLFNLIELGSSAWCVPYATRMFYGLQLNKVQNFLNMTFDGGYLPSAVGGNIYPLGWQIASGVTDLTLLTSSVTGQSLYINNTTGVTIANAGLIFQGAFQDVYNVPIIETSTAYSVRVAARNPSGVSGGVLTIQLVNYTQAGTTVASQFANPWGSFTVPLSDMTTEIQVFTGKLLTTPFTSIGGVPPTLVFSVQITGLVNGADCEIDRIEVFKTNTPYLKTQVFGSYPGQPEAIDGSSTGGIIDTTSENAQPCMGAFVLRDLLYLMKTNSTYSTQENPNSEPGGWGLHEVSTKVGTIGINSYDVGEEWMVTACRAGIFGFNGGQPTKIMQELWNLWECINWDAGNTIVLRNDIVNKRLYCAIPLPTGVNPTTRIPANKKTIVWLPVAPYNPTPTTPNVILMLNYQGMGTFEEMINSPEVHTTMFGTLAAVDMKRKWSLWNIATPDMEFIIQPDAESAPLYIGNGILSSKIYKLDEYKYSDDGVAINSLYTTYGFVNATKAATLPIFGFHAKRYTVLQTSITGVQATPGTTLNATDAMVRILPNTLTPRYPYTVPIGIPLVDPVQDDYFRSINVKGNRAFIEVSTNAVGSAFNLSKLLLTGKADPWSTLNPTGGGNSGIV